MIVFFKNSNAVGLPDEYEGYLFSIFSRQIGAEL